MVIYQGYCRPLKQKVDFTVDTVECLETKKGQKWVVKGVHEGHKITTFTNKATGESLMEQLGIKREAEEVVVFDAEEAIIEAPNHEDVAEEIEVFDAEEVVLEAPKIEHEGLTSKHYRKDGTLDMRYKICREIARDMKAESFEEIVEEDVEREMDAESLEDYTPEELATSNVNVGDITVDAGKGGYGAESFDAESLLGEDCWLCKTYFDMGVLSISSEDLKKEHEAHNLSEKLGSVINSKGWENIVAEIDWYDEAGKINYDNVMNNWGSKTSEVHDLGGFLLDISQRYVDDKYGGTGKRAFANYPDGKIELVDMGNTVTVSFPNAFDKTKINTLFIRPYDMNEYNAEIDTSFDAESYNRVYKAEPNAIIFEEHIPPEVWNNMGPDAQGHYLSTRDESVLIAPCCGVTKAELRMDENANAECGSCCYSGDDFHRRWWVNKPVPTVRAKLEAETVEQESLNPNTVVVPRFVYYKMMMHLPPNVSITQTDDGLSMIIGFHNQDAQKIDALVEAYTPVQDGSDVEDTLIVKDDLSIVPSVYYPEESMDFNAEVFNVELQEWGEQEMKTHGKDISFKDWLDEESETHGDMPLVEWAKDEEKSHDERYGAESFEASERANIYYCDGCNKNMGCEIQGEIPEGLNLTEDEQMLCDTCYDNHPDRYYAESFEVEYDDRGNQLCPPCLFSGKRNIVHADGLCVECIEYQEDYQRGFPDRNRAESFEAPESQSPKMNKTLVGLLGLGALGAFLAPEQIRALFKKLK